MEQNIQVIMRKDTVKDSRTLGKEDSWVHISSSEPREAARGRIS